MTMQDEPTNKPFVYKYEFFRNEFSIEDKERSVLLAMLLDPFEERCAGRFSDSDCSVHTPLIKPDHAHTRPLLVTFQARRSNRTFGKRSRRRRLVPPLTCRRLSGLRPVRLSPPRGHSLSCRRRGVVRQAVEIIGRDVQHTGRRAQAFHGGRGLPVLNPRNHLPRVGTHPDGQLALGQTPRCTGSVADGRPA